MSSAPPGRGTARVLRALSVAGSDATGGTGVQADPATNASLGANGMAIVTEVTVPHADGTAVGTWPFAADVVHDQLQELLGDVAVDAVRVGSLGAASVVRTVAEVLARHRPPHVVLDPGMVTRDGLRRMDATAVEVLRRRLLPVVDLVTLNLAEAAHLLGVDPATDAAGMRHQAVALRALGPAVLLTGGRFGGTRSPDVLAERNADAAPVVLSASRIPTRDTLGTGSVLSAAAAAMRPRSAGWVEAVRDARAHVGAALVAADRLGVGRDPGPVNPLAALSSPQQPAGGVADGVTDGVTDGVGDGSTTGAGRGAGGDAGGGGGDAGGDAGGGAGGGGAPTGFCDQVWSRTRRLRESTAHLPFVEGLADGTLEPAVFRDHVVQDAQFLTWFSRALAASVAAAPVPADAARLARSASGVLGAERAAHAGWFRGWGLDAAAVAAVPASPTRTGAVGHLLGAALSDDHGVQLASLLPRIWLRHHLGARVGTGPSVAGVEPADPTEPVRARWSATYASPFWAAAVATVRELTDRAALGRDAAGRRRMAAAFTRSCEYEWMSLEASWRVERWPTDDLVDPV